MDTKKKDDGVVAKDENDYNKERKENVKVERDSEEKNSKEDGFYIPLSLYEEYDRKKDNRDFSCDDFLSENRLFFNDEKSFKCIQGVFLGDFYNRNNKRLNGKYVLVAKRKTESGNTIDRLFSGVFVFNNTKVFIDNQKSAMKGYVPLNNVDWLIRNNKIMIEFL